MQISFDLNYFEDKDLCHMILHAVEAFSSIQEIDEICRQRMKHDDPSEEEVIILNRIRDCCNDIMIRT